MASSQPPHPDHPGSDSSDMGDFTYELSTPSQDGLPPEAYDQDDESSPGEESRTFISDEFDAPEEATDRTVESHDLDDDGGAIDRTVQSDDFDEPAAADSQTMISDEFDEPGVESKTMISDEFDEPGVESKTMISDEFDEPGVESKTMISDEFDEPGAESRTMISDEFGESAADLNEGTIGGIPEEMQTFVTDEDGPQYPNTGERTMVAEIDGTNEDSRTIQSDNFGDDDDDPGLMNQSNVRQTINPKSMDSKDRAHWESVIRGALGSQAATPRRRSRDSSLAVGGGSNLNIQTRTLVEGQPIPGSSVDYRIEKKLGEGGMGAVYLANQSSLNRNVALKVIKPISDKESKRLKQSGRLETIRHHREGQFLSEAVVTGDLEHPNIVPIYDVAATQDGTVFYAMKCVVGTPWSKVVRKKSLQENLDILLRVCDAVAFAHSRGVVHRDLKPENVMLGEFGVVLVMDWGLALVTPEFSKQASIRKATSLGGSPAYMAPELATGPLDRIGPAADVYLIGAMLYEIITGRPPHSGSNVSQCLRAAAGNKIDIPREQGELMDIAMRAMATRPEERYASVTAFQEAVRGYLAHAESIGLAHRAKEDLQQARLSGKYAEYARAMFGFEQALDLWTGNEPARQGLSEAQLAYAEHALGKADYELGLSLLDEQDPAHAPIVGRLRMAQQEQESRKARLAWMKRVAAVLLAVIFVGGSGALAVINQQKNEAITLREDAEKARDDAVKSERAAIASEEKAKEARDAALLAKAAEEKAKNDAIALKVQAEQSAEAEKAARLAAVEAQQRAEKAAEAEAKAKVAALAAAQAEAKAKEEALAQQRKAEMAAELEKQARELAVIAQKKAEESAEAEKKATLAALAAKDAETKAKNEAVALRIQAEEAKNQALAAKDAETKAKNEAVALRIKAEMAKDAETKAKEEALAAKEAETKAKDAALAAKEAETKAKEAALAAKEAETKAKRMALYEAYVAKIGLAKARIDQNEFVSARELLHQIKQDPETAPLCGWEWSRLMHQASQATSESPAQEPARDVTFGGSGRRAVAVMEGGRVQLFDVDQAGQLVPDDAHPLLLGAEAATAALSDDDRLIATGEADGLIRIWAAETGRLVQRLEGHRGEVNRVRFLSDGRVISASSDKTIRVWDPATGRELAVAWHIAPVVDVAFNPGANPTVAAAVADARSGRAVIWRLQASTDGWQFESIGDFVAHSAPVVSVAVASDGRLVASGDGGGRIYLWNRESVTPLNYGAAIDNALARLSTKNDSQRQPGDAGIAFVSLDDDHSERGVFRLTPEHDVTAHNEAVRSLAFSHDGTRLVSAADDFTVKIWDPQHRRLMETLRGHGGWVRSAEFSPRDDDLLISAGYDKTIRTWRLSQYAENVVLEGSPTALAAGPVTGAPEVQAHQDEIWSARFNRQGSQLVTTSRDRSARLWNVRSSGGQFSFDGPIILTDQAVSTGPKSLVEGHRYLAMSMQASPDGRTLFIGGVDGTIRLFDVERGIERGLLAGCGLNTSFALSSDGRLVLTASAARDASAQLWELGADGSVPAAARLVLSGHQYPVTAFAISPDRTRLFTGDQRGTGLLWDAQTGQQVGPPITHHEGLRINAAAFLSDGRLVTASDDLSVALYNPATSSLEQKFTQTGFVTGLAVAPQGRRILAISERADPTQKGAITTLMSIDIASGQSQTVLASSQDGPQMQIRAVRFSADGARVITVHGSVDADESLLRLWRCDTSGPPTLERTLRIPRRLPVADAALLLPGDELTVVTLHGNAGYRWSLSNLEHRQSYRSHGAITSAGFTADGKYVATGSESVKIWDTGTGKPLFRLEAPHEGAIYSLDFTPRAGRYLLATAGADGVTRIWEWDPAASNVTPVQTLAFAGQAGRIVRQVRFSPTGDRLLTVGDGGFAMLWQLGQDAPLAVLQDPEAGVVDYLCGEFSQDGQTVVVGGTDKHARLWSISAERLAGEANPPLAVLTGHADQISSVAFLPVETDIADGISPLRVLTASRDRSARVWDAATGREVISLRRHSLGLTAVDATLYTQPNGHSSVLVMTAALDGRVILWPAGE